MNPVWSLIIEEQILAPWLSQSDAFRLSQCCKRFKRFWTDVRYIFISDFERHCLPPADVFEKHPNIRCLTIQAVDDYCVFLGIIDNLGQLKYLKKLKIYGYRARDFTNLALCNSLQHLQQLEDFELSFEGYYIPNNNTCIFAKGLSYLHNLRRLSLDIRTITLTIGFVWSLEGVITHMKNLHELELYGNYVLKIILPHIPSIQSLTVHGNHTDLEQWVHLLPHLPNLRKLCLIGNQTNTCEEKTLLCSVLAQMPKLQILSLSGFGITDSEVKILSGVLPAGLFSLDLSDNCLCGDGRTELMKALTKCTELRTLNLGYYPMTDSEFEVLKILLEHLKNLVDITVPLSYFQFLDFGVGWRCETLYYDVKRYYKRGIAHSNI